MLQSHCLAGEVHPHFLTDVSSLLPNLGEVFWGCPHPRSSAEAGLKATVGDFLRAGFAPRIAHPHGLFLCICGP